MSNKQVGGIATILGKQFAFPADGGLGLVEIEGALCLVKFSCPLESMPPQGGGHVLASTDANLQLTNGHLQYGGQPVHIGWPYER